MVDTTSYEMGLIGQQPVGRIGPHACRIYVIGTTSPYKRHACGPMRPAGRKRKESDLYGISTTIDAALNLSNLILCEKSSMRIKKLYGKRSAKPKSSYINILPTRWWKFDTY